MLVIGAGPSGLAAAIAAAKAGATVMLVDENARPGGSLTYARGGSSRRDAASSGCCCRRRATLPTLQIRTGTCAAGYYADHWVPLVDARRMTKVRARAVIVAAGAFEQPAVFRNNDLPGVMLASAAQRLIYRYAVQADATPPSCWPPTAKATPPRSTCCRRGSRLPPSSTCAPRASRDAAGHASGAGRSSSGEGRLRVRGDRLERGRVRSRGCVRWRPAARPTQRAAKPSPATGSLMSVGLAPAANLLYQAGARMRYDACARAVRAGDAAARACSPRAGERRLRSRRSRLRDGERAGLQAAQHLGLRHRAGARGRDRRRAGPPIPIRSSRTRDGKNFVDFDEDLQLKDLVNAAQEGFDNIELLKRYSTVGMGPSQGKHSNMNAVRILARIRGEPIEQVGTTTARPFFHPVPMSHLAGRGFTPDAPHAAAQPPRGGRRGLDAGGRLAAARVLRACRQEQERMRARGSACRAQRVGLIDVGTLGKIGSVGPDAAAFLERVYTGSFANLKVGMTRYAVMLDESGVVIDDGVVARLAEQHFYFTTTTTGSATVYRELTRLNTMWGLQVGSSMSPVRMAR